MSMRLWQECFVVAASALLVVDLAAVEPNLVVVDGLRLVPGGNLSIDDDRIRWHVKAAAAAAWIQ